MVIFRFGKQEIRKQQKKKKKSKKQKKRAATVQLEGEGGYQFKPVIRVIVSNQACWA